MTHESFDDLIIAIPARRAAAELRLLEDLYADPRRAVPVATAEGVSDSAFEQDDHVVLWRAAVAAAPHGQRTVLAVAAEALTPHWWDESEIPGNYGLGSWWNDQMLAVLANATFPSLALTREHARVLLEIVQRVERAREAYKRCIDLLASAIDPDMTVLVKGVAA